ncbi:MAG: nucleotidyltransferase family protein [Steroidobacteraceae bacterium]
MPLELSLPAPPPPLWAELEWRLAPAVAAMHGVSGLLAATPLLDRPSEWRGFLAHQRLMTSARHRRIGALLACIDEHARREGIAMMPLKGAALYTLGLYAPGERPMADLDLLVHAADFDTAAALIAALGYRDAGTTWKHQAFEPLSGERCSGLGENAYEPIKIDLHVCIAERLPLQKYDFTRVVASGLRVPGLNSYPTLAALLLHVLVHTSGNMVPRQVRLIQLEDIARITQRMSSEQWHELLRIQDRSGRLWWAAAPLLLAQRYRTIDVPEEVIARLARGCPRLLRRIAMRRSLTEFSLSHPRIDPAPGIFWARSGAEMWAYLASRVRPTREQLEQFEVSARTGPWSAAPEWYTQSQTRRIWRWLTTRPTRIATMQPVKAALGKQLKPERGM